MDPLVAAIDQGTSSTRFLVSDVEESVKCLGIKLLPLAFFSTCLCLFGNKTEDTHKKLRLKKRAANRNDDFG